MPTTNAAPDTSVLMDLAVRAASAGAAAALAMREKTSATTKSRSGDLVTRSDVASEEAIRALIASERPGDLIIGEELGAGSSSAPDAVRWVVDPVDGTTNFVRRIEYWAVSVAATTADGAPLAGAVLAPDLGRGYRGARGRGAWRFAASDPATGERLSTEAAPSGPSDSAVLLGMGLSYEPATRSEQWQRLLALLPLVTDIRRLGSASLDLCCVAEGILDAFVESDLSEHDYAAAALVAAEAGVVVSGPDGGTPSRKLVLAAAAPLHAQLLALL